MGYCNAAHCRKGCTGTTCTPRDRRGLDDVALDNEQLTFEWGDGQFTFEREGVLLEGDLRGRYSVRMKRKH